ncbi:MAG: DUF4012 domain-containing protein [Patescibacteria group bacterium]
MLWRKKNNWENFLVEHHLVKRPRRRWPYLALIFILIIVAVGFAVLWPLATNGRAIVNRLALVQNRADIIMSSAKSGSWSKLDGDLTATRDDLIFIQNKLGQLGPITHWPPLSKNLRAADKMLSASIDLLSGYGQIFSILGDIKKDTDAKNITSGIMSPDKKLGLLSAISDNQKMLEEAKDHITSAKTELSEINTDDFNGVLKDKLIKLNNLLAEVAQNSETALPIFNHLPELMGLHAEKNYLFIFQNNMELRPTGGFIGSYGIVTLENGDIKNVFTDDVYNLDRLSKNKMQIPAPAEFTKNMGQKYWFMRDSNWSPDWPTSAKQILWFFDQERSNAGLPPQPIDGVVALTPDFISNILAVTGPITVQGVTFTSSNFAIELEKFVEFDYVDQGIHITQRKSIMGQLTKVMLDKVNRLPASDLFKLWLAFKKNIDQKNILVYLLDDKLQNYFVRQNWSGVVRKTGGDYLMVVDSNLGALKTDQVMKRSINYSVSSDKNGDLIGHLEITYQHQGKFIKDLITRYRTYTRVYAPSHSWFLKAYFKYNGDVIDLKIPQDVKISDELGKTYAATFFSVEPGESKTLVLDYRLPKEILKSYQDGAYQLTIQKQPGTSGHNLKVDLVFDKYLSAYHAGRQPQSISGKNISWSEDLSVDRSYSVKF